MATLNRIIINIVLLNVRVFFIIFFRLYIKFGAINHICSVYCVDIKKRSV